MVKAYINVEKRHEKVISCLNSHELNAVNLDKISSQINISKNLNIISRQGYIWQEDVLKIANINNSRAIFLLNPDNDDEGMMNTVPLGRVGDMIELQNLATFLMSDGCDYLTGQTIGIDGAQYLTGGGTFSQLDKLTDDDWENMRKLIRSANNKDKADRA